MCRTPKRFGLPTGLVWALVACSPALDWRQVQEPSLGLQMQYPCKPQRVVSGDMGLLQCEAQGHRFLLTWKTERDPAVLQQRLAQQAAALAARAQGRLEHLVEGRLPPQALAWPGSGRHVIAADSGTTWAQVWAQGLTLMQALVVAPGGGHADKALAAQFMDGVEALP